DESFVDAVVVGKKNEKFAAGLGDALVEVGNERDFYEISPVANARIGGGDFGNHGSGVIGGGVVGDEDFEVFVILFADALEGFAEVGGAVASGNDDGDKRLHALGRN